MNPARASFYPLPPRDLLAQQRQLAAYARLVDGHTSNFKQFVGGIWVVGWIVGWRHERRRKVFDLLQRQLFSHYRSVLAGLYLRITSGSATAHEKWAWPERVWSAFLRRLHQLDDPRQFAPVLFSVALEECAENLVGAAEAVRMQFLLYPLVTAMPESDARTNILRLAYGQGVATVPPGGEPTTLAHAACPQLLDALLRQRSQDLSSYTGSYLTAEYVFDCSEILEWLFPNPLPENRG